MEREQQAIKAAIDDKAANTLSREQMRQKLETLGYQVLTAPEAEKLKKLVTNLKATEAEHRGLLTTLRAKVGLGADSKKTALEMINQYDQNMANMAGEKVKEFNAAKKALIQDLTSFTSEILGVGITVAPELSEAKALESLKQQARAAKKTQVQQIDANNDALVKAGAARIEALLARADTLYAAERKNKKFTTPDQLIDFLTTKSTKQAGDVQLVNQFAQEKEEEIRVLRKTLSDLESVFELQPGQKLTKELAAEILAAGDKDQAILSKALKKAREQLVEKEKEIAAIKQNTATSNDSKL